MLPVVVCLCLTSDQFDQIKTLASQHEQVVYWGPVLQGLKMEETQMVSNRRKTSGDFGGCGSNMLLIIKQWFLLDYAEQTKNWSVSISEPQFFKKCHSNAALHGLPQLCDTSQCHGCAGRGHKMSLKDSEMSCPMQVRAIQCFIVPWLYFGLCFMFCYSWKLVFIVLLP